MPILLEDKPILLAESDQRTINEWVEFFNHKYPKRVIQSFIYHNGKKVKHISKQEQSKIQSKNARKYHINENYFKTWSRNMAYILGLWFADGCIYHGRIFDITLHKKDKYILKQIANELSYEGPILDYVDRQAARINFSCIVIYQDIVALGGTEQKSLTVDFPNVPEEFLPDFIRGYFDGDGCIMRLKHNRVNSAFTCGSKKFINKLWDILKNNAKVEGGSYDASCVSLKFGKKDSIKIGNYIYQNDPELFLKRKRDKFELCKEENPLCVLV